jgi:hypothetical protein
MAPDQINRYSTARAWRRRANSVSLVDLFDRQHFDSEPPVASHGRVRRCAVRLVDISLHPPLDWEAQYRCTIAVTGVSQPSTLSISRYLNRHANVPSFVRSIMFTDTRKRKLSNGEDYLEEGEFKGFSFQYDEKKGPLDSDNSGNRAIVGLSNRYSRDEDRGGTLPALDRFPDLKTLEVHKNRYVSTLPKSLAQLPNLRSLSIVRCSRIVELPPAIGSLTKLQQVRQTSFPTAHCRSANVFCSLIILLPILFQLDLTDTCALAHLPDSIGELVKYVFNC